MSIELMSNLKVITSGSKPTAGTALGQLKRGEMAFGLWEKDKGGDDAFHIFGNSNNTIVDIVLSTMKGPLKALDLAEVLTNGKVATNIMMELNGLSGGLSAQIAGGAKSKLVGGTLTIEKGTVKNTITENSVHIADSSIVGKSISMSISNGLIDNDGTNNYQLLSGNKGRAYGPQEIKNMREILDIFSKEEVENKITRLFDFKGHVASKAILEGLPVSKNKIGDVYQVIADGQLYVWVADDPEVPEAGRWEVFGIVFDLSDYYNKAWIDSALAKLKSDLEMRIDALEAGDASDEIVDLNDRMKAVEDALAAHTKFAAAGTDGMHSNNNYTNAEKDKVGYLATAGSGTGSKVLNDNGDYVDVVLVVDEI